MKVYLEHILKSPYLFVGVILIYIFIFSLILIYVFILEGDYLAVLLAFRNLNLPFVIPFVILFVIPFAIPFVIPNK